MRVVSISLKFSAQPESKFLAPHQFIKMYKVQISSSLEHHPHYIKILASDGKLINANRCNLVCVSRVIYNQLTSDPWVDPSVHSLDWKNYSSEVIEALLNLVNAGESSFPNEDLKNQVVALAKELEINITESVPVNPPKAPEALVKDENPGLFNSGDGRYTCGLCFKIFAKKQRGMVHYQDIHMTNKAEKTIACLSPGCDKKFAVMKYMKKHMYNMHGVSGKILKPVVGKGTKKSGSPIKKEP